MLSTGQKNEVHHTLFISNLDRLNSVRFNTQFAVEDKLAFHTFLSNPSMLPEFTWIIQVHFLQTITPKSPTTILQHDLSSMF